MLFIFFLGIASALSIDTTILGECNFRPFIIFAIDICVIPQRRWPKDLSFLSIKKAASRWFLQSLSHGRFGTGQR